MSIFKLYNDSKDMRLSGLIAIAVACTTQCPYCLDVHTRKAKRAGATRQEVVEASMLAAALRAGAALTHGTLALKLFDQA